MLEIPYRECFARGEILGMCFGKKERLLNLAIDALRP